jgi:hypothetical protein
MALRDSLAFPFNGRFCSRVSDLLPKLELAFTACGSEGNGGSGRVKEILARGMKDAAGIDELDKWNDEGINLQQE